jgi:hypothetical protein
MDQTSKTPLEYVSQVTELNEMSDFMQDPVVDEAMGIVVKLYSVNGHVDPGKVPALIIKLQAYAAHCALKSKYYTVFKKDSQRKNVYYTLEDALDKIVAALKYSARYGT